MTTPWTVLLGTDASGNEVWQDLSKAPHILLAGCTGSGKSEGINALLAGLLQAGTPKTTQLIVADPKRVQFGIWRRSPFVEKVVTDRDEILRTVQAEVVEMDRRYTLLEKLGMTDIAELDGTPHALPRRFFVCDEIADLCMPSRIKADNLRSQLVLGALTRLAQLGRASGNFLILATQRPAADTLPGNLRANMPTRWGFRTRTKAESRIVLDAGGCESLASAPGTSLLSWRGQAGVFVQGHYVNRAAIEAIVAASVALYGARRGTRVVGGGAGAPGRSTGGTPTMEGLLGSLTGRLIVLGMLVIYVIYLSGVIGK